jgi:hypothetical protein
VGGKEVGGARCRGAKGVREVVEESGRREMREVSRREKR